MLVAALHKRQDRTQEAIEYYEQALEYWELRHTRHPDHLSSTMREDVARSLVLLLFQIGLSDRAEQVMGILQEAIDERGDDTQA